jgi:hypothetical protein
MTDSPELWKPIAGYEGLYEISNLGRVARIKDGERFIRKANMATHYPSVSFSKRPQDKYQKSSAIHKLVAEAFCGPRPEGSIIRHLDGDRYNSKAENLKFGTVKQNVEDAVRHKIYKGSRNGSSILCERCVEAVRMLLKMDVSLSSIARKLDVSVGTIHAIKTGRNWS